MAKKHSNKLINETSPYLLQHAHNPVDWYPWGDEALGKAKSENKPILVSIGYAACHWCHVMEKESFENEETAALMNRHFINIKIDREERPDLDHIYMDAVQAITGSGGWPLNVFLTPEAKPFYGGTYFPPVKAYNRPSWQEVLTGIAQLFNERRNEADAQAENLTAHLIEANNFGFSNNFGDNFFSDDTLRDVFENLMKAADKEWGGFGKAPKFPQTFSITYLLRYYYNTNNQNALNQALLSIDKMICGGIYDQVGGGFSRYSTDTEWFAPHFEKMLYDNALLLGVICEAYQLTGNERYKKIIEHTINFLEREMMSIEDGFLSALDADSEGEEGKFYIWSFEEINNILGNDALLFCNFFSITKEGNWAESPDNNILWIKENAENFCRENGLMVAGFEENIKKSLDSLLIKREERVRPQTDDKILLGWNALINKALCSAYAATGNDKYRQMAAKNMDFLLKKFHDHSTGSYFHTYKEGVRKHPAFLDDFAYLVQALIAIQQITPGVEYLKKAEMVMNHILANFLEEESGFFWFTSEQQKDAILRKKEVYDGATPSGNAIMAYNLYHLSILLDKKNWRQMAEKMINALGNAISKYPTSFGVWALLVQEIVCGTNEIVVAGADTREIVKGVLNSYIPHKVLICMELEGNELTILTNKKVFETPYIYLCRNYVCERPVTNLDEFKMLITNKERNYNKLYNKPT